LVSGAPAGEKTLRFSKRPLMINPNEGCALADVNRDGKLDVIAGTHWYAAPKFVPRPLRDLSQFQEDFFANNGDHPYDVNGDGWVDVISGQWLDDPIYWYENPREKALAKGLLWKRHLLKKTRSENEAFFLRDLDADHVPEIVVDCWQDAAPLVAWKLVQTNDGQPALERHELGAKGCGHGMAFGDVNGDGREDILVKVGWYQRPAGDIWAGPWKFHGDWDRPHGSCPFLVTDLTGDGHNDIIWGNGHDFGLYWFEQQKPAADGKTQWTRHLIDRSYSQAHCLAWVDLDGDGQEELITGKRVRGHAGKDPGGEDPACLYYYTWNPHQRQFKRHTISKAEGIGTGMQIRTADLNEDGRVDLVVAGKSGTWILLNEGLAEAKPAIAKSAEAKPAEAKPAEAKPAKTKPAKTKPAKTKPAKTKPAKAKPAKAKPASEKPVEDVTKPAHAPVTKQATGAAARPNASDGRSVTVYVGTYTRGKSEGIYQFRMDLASGALSAVGVTPHVVNPSFLALHPTRNFLYAVNSVSDFGGQSTGAVTAFAIDGRTGELRRLNQQASGGAGPCHLVVDRGGTHVLLANYAGGSVAVLPIRPDGTLGPATAVVEHVGSSVNPTRQQGPHAHSIHVDAANRFAIAADLGLDKLLVYHYDSDHGTLSPNDPPAATVAPGAGPRHFAFHPGGRFAYVINEIDSTVTMFTYDAQRGVLAAKQTVSTLPAGFQGTSTTAEVQVSPDGRFLYGSNRGHDSIAVFSIDLENGHLRPIGQTSSGGRTPRNFGIDPTGRYLIAANQDTNNLVVFRIDPRSGTLSPTGHEVEVPMPVCVKMRFR